MRILTLLFFITFLYSCGSYPGNQDDFVTVSDGKFYISKKQYIINGINFWNAAYLASLPSDSGKERIRRELDLLASAGVNNLRVMASSELSGLKYSVKPAFQMSPGKYNEKLLDGLDYFINEAALRGMKVVLVLNNYWQWSGGMSQYLNWAEGKMIIDPDISGRWHDFMKFSAGFYESEEANNLYREYIKSLITRYNKYRKLKYNEDPAIMSWQLANEPRPHPDALHDPLKRKAFIDWIESTAEYIKSLAPDQLVSTGSEGLAGCLHDSSIFVDMHKSQYIDYVNFHLWPKNWGWFNAKNPDTTFISTMEKTFEYCKKHILWSEKLNKPAVLEEFGLERDNGSFGSGSTVFYRDYFFQKIFSMVEENLMKGYPFAGTNIWTWGGESWELAGKKEDLPSYFFGDPPQEEAGLNSVFSNDFSTLTVIKQHSENLKNFLNNK